MAIGEKLDEYMSWNGLTQKDLAKKSGISRSMISGYVVGSRTPTIAALEKIAKALDISVWALLNDEPMAVKPADLTGDELRMVGEYRLLTGEERKMVDFTLETLNRRKRIEK